MKNILQNRPRVLIGLGGRAGAGKSTASGMLQKLGCAEETFAEPIKEMVRAMVGPWTGPKEVPIPWLHGASLRDLYQSLGSEWGREIMHDDVWIWHLMRRMEARQKKCVVIADVRFPNELRFIRDNGGVTVYLERASVPEASVPGGNYAAWRRHVSEHAVHKRQFDMVIQNNDLLDLQRRMEQLMLKLTERGNYMPAPLFQRWLTRLCRN